jgi:colicin import membrane protein
MVIKLRATNGDVVLSIPTDPPAGSDIAPERARDAALLHALALKDSGDWTFESAEEAEEAEDAEANIAARLAKAEADAQAARDTAGKTVAQQKAQARVKTNRLVKEQAKAEKAAAKAEAEAAKAQAEAIEPEAAADGDQSQ